MPPHSSAARNALSVFRKKGGILRTRDLLQAGIHQRTLYALRDSGEIEQLARGLYRLADQPPLAQPDLVTVAVKIPEGVVCLISALSFHDLTTQIPHAVDIAVRRNAEPPRLEYPPIQVYRFSDEAFENGVEVHQIDHTAVRIYSREKTLADCFKFRNRIGQDTVLEALQKYCAQQSRRIDELLRCAQICRVKNIMTPYLEALL